MVETSAGLSTLVVVTLTSSGLLFDLIGSTLAVEASDGSAKETELINACASTKRSVAFPFSISVELPSLISSDVAFKTSVMFPERNTVESAPILRAGGRQNSVVAGHCLTSPWWLDTTPQGQVWSAAPLKGGWR